MDQVQTWGAVATALIAVGTVVIFGGRWAFRTLRRIDVFLDDWYGEPARPGQPARPGVPERLEAIENRVGRVETQLRPNGGSTLRDAVARIEETVRADPPRGTTA